jgi:hypothetical protein
LSQTTEGLGGRVDELRKGMGAMVGVMMTPKRKPTAVRLKKGDDKKTRSLQFDFDNGESEEIPVG